MTEEVREGGHGRGGRLAARQDRKAKQAGLRQSLEEKKNANGIDSKGLTKLPVIYTDGPVISRSGALMAEGLVMESDAASLYLTVCCLCCIGDGACRVCCLLIVLPFKQRASVHCSLCIGCCLKLYPHLWRRYGRISLLLARPSPI